MVLEGRMYERGGYAGEIGHLDVDPGGRDRVAAAVWGEAVEALATALTAYVTLLAPGLIVVGGAEIREQLLGPLRSALDSRLSFQRRPRLVRAQLGDEAGRLGAALLAWRRAGRELAHGVGAAS